MAIKLIVIAAVSVAAVIALFLLGRVLDNCGVEKASPQNGGAL